MTESVDGVGARRESLGPGGITPFVKPGRDLTERSVFGHIARLSGFMMLGFLAGNAAQLVEVAYLGVVGTKELAAIAFAFPATFALHAIGRGLATGAASLMARAHGAGRSDELVRVASHCLWLVLGFSLVCIGMGLVWAEAFFSMLGARGGVLEMAVSYSVIWLVGFPIYVIGTVAGLLLRGIGNAAAAGVSMTTGSVLQILLGPFLIFGWLGAPALGIEGAAVAFVLARSASFLIALYWFVARERLLTLRLDDIVRSWRATLHIGLPAAANNLIPPVTAAIVTRLLAEHSDLVVAGFGVATRIELLFGMIVTAVASSIGPVTGQNWGAGLYSRVRQAMRISALFSLVWGAFTLGVLWIAVVPIIEIVNSDPTIVETAKAYLLIIALSLGFVGIQNAASFCFNALGKPGPALALSVIRLIVLYLPAAIVANVWFGYLGVFWATAIVNVVGGVIAWIWNDGVLRDREKTTTVLPGGS